MTSKKEEIKKKNPNPLQWKKYISNTVAGNPLLAPLLDYGGLWREGSS